MTYKYKTVLAWGLAATAMLWSQVVGSSVSGTIRDETGAGIAETVVSVKNT